MDRTLIGAEIAWLRELRDAKQNRQPVPSLPPEVAFRLRMRGYVAVNAHGECGITIRGTCELKERELREHEHPDAADPRRSAA